MADEIIDSGAGEGAGEATPSDNSSSQEMSSEQLAANPEIQAAWSRVFGGGAGNSNEPGEAEATPGDDASEGDEGSEVPEPPKPVAKPKPIAPKPVAKEAAAESVSTLSPVLAQAASRNGWSKEDIDGFYEQNPELAERTFERLHQSANELSKRYAQLGAGRLNPQAPPVQQQPQNQPSARQSQIDALMTDEALRKFGEENGQDFVDKFLKPFKSEVLEPMRQTLAFVENQKRELLAQQINGVFGEWEKDFADHYGTSGKLTPEQNQVRYQTAQLADQIHAGAAMQGVNLSVKEALEQAHLVMTADRRAEIERRHLTQKITKRSGRLTNRPNAPRTAKTVIDGAGKSDEAAKEAYAARAAEIGFGTDV